MVMWNDLESDEKIKLYDRGVQTSTREGVYDLLVSYRSGDVWMPQIENTEALKMELGYFNECILEDKTPINDGHCRAAHRQDAGSRQRVAAHRGAEVRL